MTGRPCSVTNCALPVKSKGMCQKHYFRIWRNGTLELTRPQRESRDVCTVPGCARLDVGPHGFCQKHLSRYKRNGHPEALKGGPVPKWGEDNPSWLDDACGYGAAHDRVARRKGLASSYPCADCGNPAQQWAYNHSDPNEKVPTTGYGKGCAYSTNPDMYEPKCVPCHKRSDLRRIAERGQRAQSP